MPLSEWLHSWFTGIHLISKRILKNGDWIEIPKYAAEGNAIDIPSRR